MKSQKTSQDEKVQELVMARMARESFQGAAVDAGFDELDQDGYHGWALEDAVAYVVEDLFDRAAARFTLISRKRADEIVQSALKQFYTDEEW